MLIIRWDSVTKQSPLVINAPKVEEFVPDTKTNLIWYFGMKLKQQSEEQGGRRRRPWHTGMDEKQSKQCHRHPRLRRPIVVARYHQHRTLFAYPVFPQVLSCL